MKTKITILTLFFISLFLTSHFLLLTSSVAQEVSTPSSTIQAQEKTEYQLPYPGLLPTSPLYVVKTARDRVISFLISDPLRKSEFYLLQADKRMSAGYSLFKENAEEKHITSVISKSGKYLEKSLESAREAKKRGEDPSFILEKLSLASKKHAEVLLELENKSKGSLKQSLSDSRKKILELEKNVGL